VTTRVAPAGQRGRATLVAAPLRIETAVARIGRGQ